MAFCEWEKNKIWVWKAHDVDSRRMVAWQLGGRDCGALKKLLEKIGIEGREFVTDAYEAYHQVIPETQLFTVRDLTFLIEQNNSNTRHYLVGFCRKSKVTSRSLEMVDLSLRLYYYACDPAFLAPYLLAISSTFSEVSLLINLDSYLSQYVA